MRRLSKPGTSSNSRRPVIDKQLRTLLDTTKHESRLLGEIQRSLLEPGVNNGLRNDALHPSEISHSDWCPRASYYRLAGVEPSGAPAGTHWQMQMIFDEGREIHHKWQKRIWDIGKLGGTFYCTSCHVAWGARAPQCCEACGAGREFLRYLEVPLYNQNLTMAGHADGEDGTALIEIKSIGLGTLRFEAPGLIADHTYRFNLNGKSREFLDYDGLWNAIRRPFPSHMRQGDFYCHMSRGRFTEVIFLYEWKVSQKVKEFVVRYREDRIADRLDLCGQITLALQGGKIPACPFEGCADCQRYEEKNANGGRVLIRRAPSSEKTSDSAGDAGENNQRTPPRRLQRLGD